MEDNRIITSNGEWVEISELEKLAEIAHAINKAFAKGGWVQIPLKHDIDSVEDLLEWAKKEK